MAEGDAQASQLVAQLGAGLTLTLDDVLPRAPDERRSRVRVTSDLGSALKASMVTRKAPSRA